MAHFYGTLKGSRGEATRTGTKQSGIATYAAGWGGAIRTVLYHVDGKDMFRVEMVEWKGAGKYRVLAVGEVGNADSAVVLEG